MPAAPAFQPPVLEIRAAGRFARQSARTCVSHFLSASEKGVRSTLVHFLHDLLLAREPFIQLKQLLLVKLVISDISTFLSLILMPVSRGLSSEWIIPPCVRASPSSGKLKTYGFALYFLKFQKVTYVFYGT